MPTPASGVAAGEAISKQLNCEATWNTASACAGSACSAPASPTTSRTRVGEVSWAGVPARNSASDGVENRPAPNVRPFTSDVSRVPSSRRFARTRPGPSSAKPVRVSNHVIGGRPGQEEVSRRGATGRPGRDGVRARGRRLGRHPFQSIRPA